MDSSSKWAFSADETVVLTGSSSNWGVIEDGIEDPRTLSKVGLGLTGPSFSLTL
jgi:hypothetical protein